MRQYFINLICFISDINLNVAYSKIVELKMHITTIKAYILIYILR